MFQPEQEVPSTSSSTPASSPVENVTDTTSPKFLEASEKLQKVVEDLERKVQNPECQETVLAFCKEYEKLKTQGSWKAAMHCFNKQNLSHAAITAIRKKYASRKRGYACRRIPVQSTALARRQIGVKRGRAPTAAGRPSKGKQANIAKAAKTNRPHSLSYQHK